MTDRWHAIEITADPCAVEALEFLFNELGSLGTEVQQFHKKEEEPLTIIGYFDVPPDERSLDEGLSDALRIYDLTDGSVRSLRRKTVEETDWLAEWKKHWRPTRVGRFVVLPEWEKASDIDPETLVIRIDPGMAFGTGTHETTRLCLKAIDEHLRPDDRFLDVGTGTGILAIAAAKLARAPQRRITAIDNDLVAVQIARENARQNEVAEMIEFSRIELSETTPQFDFVCANLTLDVIRPLLPLLLRKTQRLLVLSGVLTEQESALVHELKLLGVSNIEIEAAGEWISATVER